MSTPAMLDLLVNELVTREGGYSNHPSDKGGETIYGITAAVARAFGYNGPMQSMPVGVARTIYARRFWEEPRFNEVAEISVDVAEELLDTGVLMGPATGVKYLQRALNVLNAQGKHFPDITADGVVGPMTLAALRGLLAKRGKDGEEVLVRMMNAQQSVRLMELAEANPTQEDFEFGWQLNRVKSL